MKQRNGYRLFKQTYRARDGTPRTTANWYVEFRDQREKVRRLSAFPSRKASEKMGENLVALVAYHVANGGQVDPALSVWLTTLPARTRDKLVAYGLLPRERADVAKPLHASIADWRAALLARGNTAAQADLVTARAQKIIDGCGFTYYADSDGERVAAYLSELRQDTQDKRGISAQTYNFHVAATKGFRRRMVRNRRATESPVVHLDPLNVRTDRRHDRRALTVDELHTLLDKTTDGPERCGMTGSERAMMYRLAVETGLRANEIRRLTRASFKLDGPEPTVTVAAAYSKHRREDVIPLRAELAAELREFLTGLAPAAQVFKLTPSRHHAAKMFRADVEAAGIARVDDAGRYVDFHALRHTFITNLANGGVHPKVAQTLARHCTITLTMDRYSHVVRGDQAAALDVLPDLSGRARQQARATGTDHARASDATGDSRWASCWAFSGQRGPAVVDSAGGNTADGGESQDASNARFSAENSGKFALGRGAGVAERAGLENRWASNRPVGSNPTLSGSTVQRSPRCMDALNGRPAMATVS